MKLVIYLTLFISSIVATASIYSGQVINTNRSTSNQSTVEKNKAIKIAADLIVTDSFFFSGALKLLSQVNQISSDATTLSEAQVFGCSSAIQTSRKKINVRIELHVPGKPENFPFHVGRVSISPDKKTVIADVVATTDEKFISYYWGIGSDDPKGDYTIKCSIEGTVILSHKFVVK
jgi:hypothetical protein